MLNRFRALLEELLAQAEAEGVLIRVTVGENQHMEHEVFHHPKGPPSKRSFPVVPRRPVADKPKKGSK